jgi:hypothetical protein
MTLLDIVPNTNTDCRKYKKNWGNSRNNERDWHDWLYQHELEYKFQNIIRRKYLYNFYAVQVRDLAAALRRDFLLSWENICAPSTTLSTVSTLFAFL